MSSNRRFFYIRDAKGFPVAAVAAAVDEGAQLGDSGARRWVFSASYWNPVDTFDRKLGRKIAEGRLREIEGKLYDFRNNNSKRLNETGFFADSLHNWRLDIDVPFEGSKFDTERSAILTELAGSKLVPSRVRRAAQGMLNIRTDK